MRWIVLVVAGCNPSDPVAEPRCADVRSADARALCDACVSGAGSPDLACVEFLETPSLGVRCGGGLLEVASPLRIVESSDCVEVDGAAPIGLTCGAPPDGPLGAAWDGLPVEPADGAGVHEEREYTFTTDGTDPARDVIRALYAAAEVAVLDTSRWQAPALIGSVDVGGVPVPVTGYGLSGELDDDGELQCCTDIAVVDIHLDDAARSTLEAEGEFRSRFRFPSADQAWDFLWDLSAGKGLDEDTWPNRVEIQAKTERVFLGGGLSSVVQSRFSLEAGFPPFLGEDGGCWGSAAPGACWLPLPPQPWDPREYLRGARTGVLSVDSTELALRPAIDLRDWHGSEGPTLVPSVALVTARQRFHPTVLFELGLGFPGVSDAFIVSLDDVEVYAGGPFVAWLEGAADKPVALATFRELDVEFEPDVSQRVDQAIAAGGPDVAELLAIEAAFLADLDTWAAILAPVLAGGASGTAQDVVVPAAATKYGTAVASGSFARGDLDRDGAVATSDAAALLALVYLGIPPASLPAADIDANGATTEADALRLVARLYAGGPPLTAPGPEPGIPCW